MSSGLVLVGPSVGLFYQASPRVWLFGSLQALGSVPTTMVNLDGAAGVAVRL